MLVKEAPGFHASWVWVRNRERNANVSRTLTIFIDGLPFDQLEKLPFTRNFASKARLIPILGYSVNCQTELFTGKRPDEVGFWGEWTYSPKTAQFRKFNLILKWLSIVEISYYAKRIVHRLLDRLRLASATKNIPLSYLGSFDESGHSVLTSGFEGESLLQHDKMNVFLHTRFPVVVQRDEDNFQDVKRYIDEADDPGSILATFTRIDGCSHWEGVASEPYDELLLIQDRYIKELSEAYLAKVPDGTVLVASDHGMTNVTDFVKVELEAEIGKPDSCGYAYFTEGTILRVWCEDVALRERIQKYLDGLDGLEELGDDDRKEFGITRPEFGDLIYHTLESYQIVPSYWGPKPSVGMHGYHPRYRSQHGICLSSREGDFEGNVSATDFYHVLSRYLDAA